MGWHTIFEGIFILSLKEKTNRQETLKVELERVGMNLEKVQWVSAMNGKRPEIRTLVERLGLVENSYLPFFTPGHLGCLASHYFLWFQLYTKHINESLQDKWYLILEDDTRFLPFVSSETIQAIWNQKPVDASLIKFHATYGYKQNPNLISIDANECFRKQTKLSFSLMCYAIHTSCLSTLLFTKWKNHIDLFHFEGIYLIKTPQGIRQTPQTLYSSEGLFAEGICLTNNELDSDTVSPRQIQEIPSFSPVQQLCDSVPPIAGTYSVHLYDDFQPTGTCHVHFQVELKDGP